METLSLVYSLDLCLCRSLCDHAVIGQQSYMFQMNLFDFAWVWRVFPYFWAVVSGKEADLVPKGKCSEQGTIPTHCSRALNADNCSLWLWVSSTQPNLNRGQIWLCAVACCDTMTRSSLTFLDWHLTVVSEVKWLLGLTFTCMHVRLGRTSRQVWTLVRCSVSPWFGYSLSSR